MEKKFLNLGSALSRDEQKKVHGGNYDGCAIGSVAQYQICMNTSGSSVPNCQEYARAWYNNCRGAQQ
ncbi:MAG: hypothetical protein HEQ40_10280 [Lacibacter sp.]|jgi:hypothetical protein